MRERCICGAPALELGLCGFCLEHSPAIVRALIRRMRDRISQLEAAPGVDKHGNCLACGAYFHGYDGPRAA